MIKLTSETVHKLMLVCLANDDSQETITIDGLVNSYLLDKAKIASRSEQIRDLLDQLQDPFQASKGGGWSFLNACNDRDGHLWTGEHRIMEALICLGIAANRAKWLMKEMAHIMPGGVPYVVVGIEPTSQEKSL